MERTLGIGNEKSKSREHLHVGVNPGVRMAQSLGVMGIGREPLEPVHKQLLQTRQGLAEHLLASPDAGLQR
jgi:hypothetical protein